MLIDTILSKGTISIWNDKCEYDGVEDKNELCVYEGKTVEMACF